MVRMKRRDWPQLETYGGHAAPFPSTSLDSAGRGVRAALRRTLRRRRGGRRPGLQRRRALRARTLGRQSVPRVQSVSAIVGARARHPDPIGQLFSAFVGAGRG